MTDLIFDEAARLWRADKVDFGTGSISLRVRFRGTGDAAKGTVTADGQVIGVAMLTGDGKPETEAV